MDEGFPELPDSWVTRLVEEEWTGKRWRRLAVARDEPTLEQLLRKQLDQR